MTQVKIQVRSILLQLTQKSALKCKHCYMSAGKDGESLTLDKVKRIIRHIPSNVQSIMLTGGDPFMEKKLLLGTVKAVMKREFSHLGTLSVQTTGYWATSKQKAEAELEPLIKAGVNEFSIYGDDKWHIEGGLNPTFHANIIAVLKNYGFEAEDNSSRKAVLRQVYDFNRRKYILRGTGSLVHPVGRAASLVKKSQIQIDASPICTSGRDFLTLHRHGYYYIIDYHGEVYNCIWQKIPSLGNAINESIAAMLKKAKMNPVKRLEDAGNIIELAKFLGYSDIQAMDEINRIGRCKLHEKLINEKTYE